MLLALKPYFWHNCYVEYVHNLTDNSTTLAHISNVAGMHSVLCYDTHFFYISNLVAKAPGLNFGKKLSNLGTVRP